MSKSNYKDKIWDPFIYKSGVGGGEVPSWANSQAGPTFSLNWVRSQAGHRPLVVNLFDMKWER